jgi:Fe-S cluster assembly scaffold protein SufB
MTEKIDLSKYQFTGIKGEKLTDLRTLSEDDKEQLLMAGVDADEVGRSGSFLHVDHGMAYEKTLREGVEIMDIKEAMEKVPDIDDYLWKLVDKDKDEFTKKADTDLQGGYFVRVKKGVKLEEPVQSCLFIKHNKAGQAVHNIVIVEEDAELHLITGCSVSRSLESGIHIGVSEFYIKKGGKLTFTMVHNWGEQVEVRPRSVGVVEEGGQFLNNYILIRPVKSLQMYPTIHLNGPESVARFNSVVVSPKGTHLDMGNRVLMNAPDTKCEIIARTITTGGTILNRGHIQGNHVPGRGHLECKGLILGEGIIHAIPELEGTVEGVELSHEAAVGKIAQEEIEYLMARGLDEDQATSTIVRGFLNVDIMGLPDKLRGAVDKIIEESEKDMF